MCRHDAAAEGVLFAAKICTFQGQCSESDYWRAPPKFCFSMSAPHRHLSSRLFTTPHATFHPLYDFLRTLQNNGKPMMVGKRITCVDDMQKALSAAEKLLQRCDAQVQLTLLPGQVLRSAGALAAGHLSFNSWPNGT